MSNGKRCGLLSICISLVAIIVYVAVAIEGVEPTEIALIKNNLSQDVNREVQYTGGLRWVGVFYSLIHFPYTHKTIEFSSSKTANFPQLQTRTREGLELRLSFSF